MGQRIDRKSTAAEKTAKDQKQQLLDTQELAASLFEQNTTKDQQILDLQTMVASLVETGGKA